MNHTDRIPIEREYDWIVRSLRRAFQRRPRVTLSEGQDVDVNYYVLVPFTTFDAAEWAHGEISCMFDCHVISAAAVDRETPLLTSSTTDDLGSSPEVGPGGSSDG